MSDDQSSIRWIITQHGEPNRAEPYQPVPSAQPTQPIPSYPTYQQAPQPPSDPWQRPQYGMPPTEPVTTPPAAPPPAQKRPSSVSRGASEFVRTLLLAALVFVGARLFVLPYEVEGASMTPNLHDRERVLVNRSVYYHFDLNKLLNAIPGVQRDGEHIIYPFHSPERGDIVVLHPPVKNSTQPYIKRVIGLAGETVSFKDGYVYINGEKLEEPYINGPITQCVVDRGCHDGTVPAGYVFVLGDNRDNSADSRSFGFVKVDEIIGKAWFANWPLDRIGILPSYDYTG